MYKTGANLCCEKAKAQKSSKGYWDFKHKDTTTITYQCPQKTTITYQCNPTSAVQGEGIM